MNEQTLGRLVMQMVTAWEEMKATGVTHEQCLAGLESLLRERWPRGREKPWGYICEDCRDTGLRIYVCRIGQRCNGISQRGDGAHDRPGKYRRLCAQFPDSTYEHEYGEPCLCRNGDRWIRKPRTFSDELADAAAKPKPQKSFSRFGR